MTKVDLSTLTDDQLVKRFEEIGLAQDASLDGDDRSLYNRLFKQMMAVDDELRRRGAEARLKLMSLFSHPNIQVRIRAAARIIGLVPVEARNVLQAAYDTRLPIYALDAGMLIENIDNGTWKPD